MSGAPEFDDTRKALAFAFNAHRSAAPPRPAASAAMSAAPGKKPKKPRTKKAREEAEAERLERADAERRQLVRAVFGGPRAPRTEERDRAARAGLILAVVDRLDEAHRTVLAARLVESHSPCSCRSPCCSGRAVSLRWSTAIGAICDMLKDRADLLRVPGKRGLSTLPQLRRAVVQSHFDPRADGTIVALAAHAGVSAVTAAKHRAAIVEWLEAAETEAWQQAALLLDQAGVTGEFTN